MFYSEMLTKKVSMKKGFGDDVLMVGFLSKLSELWLKGICSIISFSWKRERILYFILMSHGKRCQISMVGILRLSYRNKTENDFEIHLFFLEKRDSWGPKIELLE